MSDPYNFTRTPIHAIPANQELMKGGYAGTPPAEHTNFTITEDVPTVSMSNQDRVPTDRVLGNVVFRRYLNGMLDFDYAKHKVIDAINKVKLKQGIEPEDCYVLNALFPNVGTLMIAASGVMVAESAMRTRLTPMEVEQVRQDVAAHFLEVLNWNAGRGGGSVPGRSSTYQP